MPFRMRDDRVEIPGRKPLAAAASRRGSACAGRPQFDPAMIQTLAEADLTAGPKGSSRGRATRLPSSVVVLAPALLSACGPVRRYTSGRRPLVGRSGRCGRHSWMQNTRFGVTHTGADETQAPLRRIFRASLTDAHIGASRSVRDNPPQAALTAWCSAVTRDCTAPRSRGRGMTISQVRRGYS